MPTLYINPTDPPSKLYIVEIKLRLVDEIAGDLSARENQILELLATGKLYKEIGSALLISTETVRKHVYNLYGKLKVQNRTEAVNKFYGR